MTTITNSKLTDERVSNSMLIRLIQWADQHNSHYVAAALCELQERRKADNQEPAGYHVIKECEKIGCSVATLEEAEKTRDFWNKKWTIRPYFYTAQPAPERERIRREHAEWSDKTFGDVGPVGPLKHLSKEALEAAADPSDPLEWADMQFLLWDAQRRAGITDKQITLAMEEKLAVNKKREWPEPKDGEPRLHIKEQPAPVVPEEMPKGLAGQIVSLLAHNIGDKFLAQKIWNACRNAMLQANQRDLSQPVDPQVAEYEKIMLQAGWVMVPVEPTDEMIVAAMDSDDVTYNESDDTVFYVHHREIYKAMLAAAPKPEAGPCTK
ncbi:TPA: DUF550 domain-containing protein [Salmonella enterica subsp. enterica serovar Cotham]|nr:DUF550 domain-containing protein [Salmonella bongori]